jgi:integrase
LLRPEGWPVNPKRVPRRWPEQGLQVPQKQSKRMEKVGIQRKKSQYGFHLFRHSAASLLYDKLRDVKLVQVIMRHSKVATTADIYALEFTAAGIGEPAEHLSARFKDAGRSASVISG